MARLKLKQIDTTTTPLGALTVTQTAHALGLGAVVGRNTAGTAWALSRADNANTLGVGLVGSVVDADTFEVWASGFFTLTNPQWDAVTEAVGDRGAGATGLQPFQYYYLSGTTAGKLTITDPTSISQPIGFATAQNTLYLLTYRPFAKTSSVVTMVGATTGAAGAGGTVPQPAAGENTRPLLGSGRFTPAATEAISIVTGTTGVLTLDTATSGAINVGTNANGKTVTIGNVTGNSNVLINSGTSGVTVNSVGQILIGTTTGNTIIRSGGSINIGDVGASAVGIGGGGGVINIGATATTGTISIGTGAAARTIAIGNVTGATTTSIAGGSGGVQVGSGTMSGWASIHNNVGLVGANPPAGTVAGLTMGYNSSGGAREVDILHVPGAAGNFAMSLGSWDGTTKRRVFQINTDGAFVGPAVDNVTSLGAAGNRFTAVFAVNGTINTSDITLKSDVIPLTVADAGDFVDYAASQSIVYGWKDRKDDSRRYSGLSAQGMREQYPDKVFGDKDGEYGISYSGSMAELIVTCADLRRRVSVLEGV
jgi:hypothetical protein